jgi:hypothetical protein
VPAPNALDREAFEAHVRSNRPDDMALEQIAAEISDLDRQLRWMIADAYSPLSLRMFLWPLIGFSTVLFSIGAFFYKPNTLSLMGILIGFAVGLRDLGALLRYGVRASSVQAANRRIARRKFVLEHARRNR